MKHLWQQLVGKRQNRQAVTGRWFYAALVEANYGAGRLAYGW